MSEIFEYNIAHFPSSNDLHKNKMKLIHPDQYQIKNLALDMVSYINNNFRLSESDEKFSELYNLIQSQKYKVDILRDALVPIETTSSS